MTDRGDRRAKTERIKMQRVRLVRDLRFPRFSVADDWPRRELKAVAGTFRDSHPFDCGRANCFTCHWEKLSGDKTMQERRADQELAEA